MTGGSSVLPEFFAHAFPAAAFRVVSGANLSDPITGAAGIELGDVYRLGSAGEPSRLFLTCRNEAQVVGAGSEIGLPGEPVSLSGVLTLMAPDGDKVDILVLNLHDSGEFFIPLSPLRPRVEYTLIAASEDAGEVRVTDMICVSFAAGTLITRPGGAQVSIEALSPGEMILTRANGPQPIRWIGKATMRAHGAFAPVVIGAGVLGNLHDLVVSPHHRVFLYQRGERRLGPTAEILVQAKHLVDGDRVTIREGGFVDYFSLVFDRHEVIYAEGIPAESLMVTESTLTALPEAIATELRTAFPGLRHSPHYGTEIDRRTIETAGRDHLFRKPRS